MRSTTACTPSEHVSPSSRCHVAQLHRAGHVGPKGASAREASGKVREGNFPARPKHALHMRPTPGQRCVVELPKSHSLTLEDPARVLIGCRECSTMGRARWLDSIHRLYCQTVTRYAQLDKWWNNDLWNRAWGFWNEFRVKLRMECLGEDAAVPFLLV